MQVIRQPQAPPLTVGVSQSPQQAQPINIQQAPLPLSGLIQGNGRQPVQGTYENPQDAGGFTGTAPGRVGIPLAGSPLPIYLNNLHSLGGTPYEAFSYNGTNGIPYQRPAYNGNGIMPFSLAMPLNPPQRQLLQQLPRL